MQCQDSKSKPQTSLSPTLSPGAAPTPDLIRSVSREMRFRSLAMQWLSLALVSTLWSATVHATNCGATSGVTHQAMGFPDIPFLYSNCSVNYYGNGELHMALGTTGIATVSGFGNGATYYDPEPASWYSLGYWEYLYYIQDMGTAYAGSTCQDMEFTSATLYGGPGGQAAIPGHFYCGGWVGSSGRVLYLGGSLTPDGAFIAGTAHIFGPEPTAGTVTAGNITDANAGESSYSFTIDYSDSDGNLDLSSIGISDVTVCNGGSCATGSSTSSSGNASNLTVTYTVTPPGGTWSGDDSGTFTVAILSNEVADGYDAYVAGDASAGSFTVLITNTPPSQVTDGYATDEDFLLTADDGDGSANGDANDNGVLANDSDADGDPLSVVGPGTYAAAGIGGSITIAADGTFLYTPPADQSGQATFAFDITDGSATVPSSLTIDVSPLNDPPSFVADNVSFPQGGRGATQVGGWAGSISAGPPDESGQQLSFATTILSDPDAILNSAEVDNSGNLDLNLTSEGGSATLEVTLMDDGGGDDQSEPFQFDVGVTRAADLVTVIDNGLALLPGGTNVIYQMTVDNVGPADVAGATLTADIPLPLSGATWVCAGTGGASCPLSGSGSLAESVDLPMGGEVIFEVTVSVPLSPEQMVDFTADATVPAGTQENDPVDNEDTDSDQIGVFGDGF